MPLDATQYLLCQVVYFDCKFIPCYIYVVMNDESDELAWQPCLVKDKFVMGTQERLQPRIALH